jgi:ribosomal protein S16
LVESLVIAEEMKRLQTAIAPAHSAQLGMARMINMLGGAAFKPSKDTKDIVLDPEQPERTIRIGARLSEKSESALVDFLH